MSASSGHPSPLVAPTAVDAGVVGPAEEWLHLAIDSLVAGVVVLDAEGRIVFANTSAVQMYGLPLDQLRGRRSFDPAQQVLYADGTVCPPEDMPAWRCLRTGEEVDGVVTGTHSRQRDQFEWHRVDARPIWRDGEQVGVILLFEDITETMEMRHELERSGQQLAEARRAGRVGLWEWDAEPERIWCDDHFREITGRRFNGTLKAWLDDVDPRDRQAVTVAMRRLAPGVPVDVTYRLVPEPGGPVRWVSAHAEVLETDEHGAARKVAGSLVDVTEAQEATAHLRRLLDSMADGYYTLDSDWRVTYINRKGVEILGHTGLVGQIIWDEFPGSAELLHDLFDQALAGEAVESEIYYEPLGGWFEVRVFPMDPGVAVHFREVSERRRQQEERERLYAEAEDAHQRLARAALHDDLTDLPNRTALVDWMAQRSANGPQGRTALLYLDLDRFKLVNDTYGHTTGDSLLIQAARRLRAAVRPNDLVVRLGGDEFIVALSDTSAPEVRAVAERVVEAFRTPFVIGSRHVVVTTSIGVAIDEGELDPEALMSNADAALYRAKDAGRNQVGAFDESLRASAWQRLATEADLRDALKSSVPAIVAHFQPIFDLRSGQAVAAEALARWTHPQRGRIEPSQFVPIAEETGLIVDLGWVMLESARAALPQMDPVMRAGKGFAWVNVAPRQLDEPGFTKDLLTWARDHDLLGRLGIEITESALSGDAAADSSLRELAAEGLAIAIDDFGTGFSSLSRLSRFPVNLLKVDRSFVQELDTPAGRGIVSSIVSLAHSIGAAVCAEGVEEAWQVPVLTELGVDTLSGYHLCPPRPIEEFTEGVEDGAARLAG